MDFVGFRKCVARDSVTPYELVFHVPKGMTLQGFLQKTLQESIVSPPSLNRHVGLCAQLASAVLYVHGELEMVHKNINTSNISLAEVKAEGLAIKTLALRLASWRCARDDSSATDVKGASDWAGRLYQHPEQQVSWAEAKYSMGHDSHSLSICMLEILV
jgi:hypothetical protein